MKTIFIISAYLVIFCLVMSSLTSCGNKNKRKPTAVVTNSSVLTAGQKLESAIDERVGIFRIVGIIDNALYILSDNKTISISKIAPSKIRITANNFPMDVFEFEVQNGATVSNGVISGSDEGKAIGYSGLSAPGQIVFSCDEVDKMALVVSGNGASRVSISGSK